MRPGYSAAQIRDAERPLLDAGVPLMRRAAAGLAHELREAIAARHVREPRVLLLVGSGDNGGDALYAGAELAAAGVTVLVAAVGSRVHEAGLAAALDAGATRIPFERIHDEAAHADVVVDGLVGTGSGGRGASGHALRGPARDAAAAVLPALARPHRPTVVAVDLPSGVDPDTGQVPDAVMVPADVTVTFGGVKAGLLLPPGSDVAGRVVLVEIGLDLDGVEPLLAPAPR